MREDQRFAFCGLDDHRAGPVTKEHGCVPVILVGDLREGVRTYDESAFVPRIEQRDSCHEPVNETGARGIQVERGTAAAELVVHRRRGRGHGLVGRCRSEHEQVDLGATPSRAL